ncbi:hypothetical protein GW17_00035113 [Ensete ventricosum]|nr:hypothetical protein GW17_00035113 [Ensete ventricosum]
MGESKFTKGCSGWLIVLVIAALVVAAAVFAIKKKQHHREVLPVPGPPGAINQKYADALGVALQFFQVQKYSTIFAYGKMEMLMLTGVDQLGSAGMTNGLELSYLQSIMQVLLSRVNFFSSSQSSNADMKSLQSYRKTAEAVMCGLLPDSPTATSSRTDGICFHHIIPLSSIAALILLSVHSDFLYYVFCKDE